MDRKLLLLGLLRMHEMHGYQINELIDAHLGTSIEIKKPTVYKLLKNMLERGWISYREEQEGNYPTRRVYAIQPKGEKAFQTMLRENLAQYRSVSYLNNIGIVYLEALPVEEAVSLLRHRKDEVAGVRKEIHALDEHQGGFQRMLSNQLHHLQAELNWLDEEITKMVNTG